MPEISKTHMGGTMRLGLRPTVFEEDAHSWSKVRKLYGGAGKIWERHRHRYEVNPEWVNKLAASGLNFCGKDEKKERMQVLELPGMFSPLYCFSVLKFSMSSRTPILRRSSGASRVLYPSSKPIATISWICCSFIWP